MDDKWKKIGLIAGVAFVVLLIGMRISFIRTTILGLKS